MTSDREAVSLFVYPAGALVLPFFAAFAAFAAAAWHAYAWIWGGVAVSAGFALTGAIRAIRTIRAHDGRHGMAISRSSYRSRYSLWRSRGACSW